MAGKLPANFDDTIAAYKQKLATDKPKVATRKSSEMALEVINGALAETIGGSADLTPSNNTKTSQTKELSPAITATATSTTASASTPWPPPSTASRCMAG